MSCGVNWDGVGANWSAGAGLDFGYIDQSHELGFQIAGQQAHFQSWSHSQSTTRAAVNADCLADAVAGYK